MRITYLDKQDACPTLFKNHALSVFA